MIQDKELQHDCQQQNNTVAARVLELFEEGIPVFPCTIEKKPLVRWKRFQSEMPSRAQVEKWLVDPRVSCWAFPTGQMSGIIAADFDGAEGVALVDEVGIQPHVRTPSGGHHLYVQLPASGTVNNDVRALPGLDVRGEGGYVCFAGYADTNHPVTQGITGGWYETTGHHPPVGVDELPPRIRAYFEPPAEQLKQHLHEGRARRILEKHLKKAKPGNRNDTGFKLCCELRRARLAKPEAEPWIREFQRRVPGDGYTEDEALRSLDSAYGNAKPSSSNAAVGGKGEDMAELIPLSDSGNAERLAARHGDDLRYVRESRRWTTWAGDRWDPEGDADANRRALETMRNLQYQAAEIEDQRLSVLTFNHAKKSESYTSLQHMLACARSVRMLEASRKDFDRDLFLLNCTNGTVNLRTGRLQPHRREDMLTKSTGIEYDPDAQCPEFMRFVDRITNGNQEIACYLQNAVGYSLTGDVSERCLFICYGTGANGKSTFLDAIAEMVGNYGQRTMSETIMVSKRGGGVNNDVATLAGVRFAYANESDEGDQLDEGKLKDLTGADVIRARFLYQEGFEFRPQYKIWLATNHKPAAKGTDDGIYDRLRLIPFTVRIAEGDRIPRSQLAEQFRAEMSGILAWAVRGCLCWQKDGLRTPKLIRDEVDEYRQDMDTLGQFLQERCVVLAPTQSIPARALYNAYTEFEKTGGRLPTSETRFSLNLKQRGYQKLKGRFGASWSGLVLRNAQF